MRFKATVKIDEKKEVLNCLPVRDLEHGILYREVFADGKVGDDVVFIDTVFDTNNSNPVGVVVCCKQDSVYVHSYTYYKRAKFVEAEDITVSVTFSKEVRDE